MVASFLSQCLDPMIGFGYIGTWPEFTFSQSWNEFTIILVRKHFRDNHVETVHEGAIP